MPRVELAKSVEQLLAKTSRRKESSRAGRRRQITVQPGIFAWNVQICLQALHQADKLGHLPVGERPAIAVADHADRDGMLIVMGGIGTAALHVSSGQLLIPAVADVNYAIPQPIAVPDQKVIAQTLVTKAFVPAVN